MQEGAAARLLHAASTAAQLAGTHPKLLQQLSNASQLQPSNPNASSGALDTAINMSALSEQLPWQLRLQPTEQLPDSAGEQAGAGSTVTPSHAEPWRDTHLSRVARALGVGSIAEQQPLQQQRLSLVSMTTATSGSSDMGDVSMTREGMGDEEAAAKAAYRQWSESFEADRVWGQCNIDTWLAWHMLSMHSLNLQLQFAQTSHV